MTTAQTLPPSLAARLARLSADAAARGVDLSATRRRACAAFTPARAKAVSARPATVSAPSPVLRGLTVAINKPAPTDWQHKARKWEARHTVEATALRLVAKMVCRALGPDWLAVPPEGWNGWALTHRPTGAVIHFRHHHNDGRYCAAPKHHARRNEAFPDSITMAGNRTPASMAADIQRRLIANGLLSHHAEVVRDCAERRRNDIGQRLTMLRVARAIGVQFKRHYSRGIETDWRTWPANAAWDAPKTEIKAESMGAYGVCLTLRTSDIDLVEAVSTVIKGHFSK